jgi:transposase-like protein
MNRKPNSQNPPCPRCGATHVVKNGSKGGRPRWVCRNGGRSFGPTLGTAMDRWRVTPAEVARTLRVGMRRGSRSAAEEITGHKYETIGRWLRMAAQHAEALTEVLVHDLQARSRWMLSGRLSKKVSGGWRSRRLGGRGGPAWGMFEPGPGDSFWGGVGL